jgi:hypothetical protein
MENDVRGGKINKRDGQQVVNGTMPRGEKEKWERKAWSGPPQ